MSKSFRINSLTWLAIVGGLAIHLAGFLLFSVQSQPQQNTPRPSAFVKYDAESNRTGGSIVREQAALFDSEPLFLPTRWNATQNSTRSPAEPETIDSLSGEANDLYLTDAKRLGSVGAFSVAAVPQSPEALLSEGEDNLLSIFGTAQMATANFSERSGIARVINTASSEVVIQEMIPPDVLGEEAQSLWQPAEFAVSVDALGTLGEPLLNKATGNQSIDAALLNWIQSSPMLQELDPGYYWVRIGP